MRNLGTALSLAGAVVLGYAGVTYARGAVERDRARSRWEHAVARAARTQAVAAAHGGIAGKARPGVPVARLVIPALALDEVVVEGVGDRELNRGPGHMPLSVAPGAAGNAVLSAHRDRHFARLGALRLGDTVTTQTLNENVTWIVVRRQIVARDARVLTDRGLPELTLTTCWPIRWLGPAPQRLIVTAAPLRRDPIGGALASRL